MQLLSGSISYFINIIIKSNERYEAKRYKNQLQFWGRPDSILVIIWVELTLL